MAVDNRFSGKKAVLADRVQTNISYYGILGLEPGATSDAIKSAFIDAIREFNPASPLSADESKVAQVLIEAYHVLSDQKLKAKYDGRFGDIEREQVQTTITTSPMFWLYGDSRYRAKADYDILKKGVMRIEDSHVLDLSDRELASACVWAMKDFAKGPSRTKEYKDAVMPEGVPATEAYYDSKMAILRQKLRDPMNKEVAITLAALGGFAEVKNLAAEFVIAQDCVEDLVELAGRESCTGETRLHAVQRLTNILSKEQLKQIDLFRIPPIAHLGTQEINLHTVIYDATRDPPELPFANMNHPALLDRPNDRLHIKGLPGSKQPALLAAYGAFTDRSHFSVEQICKEHSYLEQPVATQELKVNTLSVDELFAIYLQKLPGRIRAAQELIHRADKADSQEQLLGLGFMFREHDDPISKACMNDVVARTEALMERKRAQKAADPESVEGAMEPKKAQRRKSNPHTDAIKAGAPRPVPPKQRK